MSTFHLQIVTPDGGFFDGEAEKLIVRAIDGDVCILARHLFVDNAAMKMIQEPKFFDAIQGAPIFMA